MNSIFNVARENKIYYEPSPASISIIAGRPNNGANALTPELCEEVSSCGFNGIAAAVGADVITSSLQNCFENGLKLLLYNSSLQHSTSSFVKDLKDKKGLGGWLLAFNKMGDDSGEVLNQNMSPKKFKEIYDEIHQLDSKRLIFVGLSGDWEYPSQYLHLDMNFPEYIADYQISFQPSFWPYLYLPDLASTQGSTNISSSRIDMFYKSLQYFAYVSRYTAAPFWAYCRCQGFTNYQGFDAPAPTIERMRGVVFSSLAYGAKGIYYWNYRPYLSNNTTGKVIASPVDSDGNKTDVWEMVKTVNTEIKAFNSVFWGSEMLDCRHFNYKGNSQFIKKWEYPMGPLIDISPVESSNNLSLLISHFNNTGKNYLMIVADPFESDNTRVTFQFRFSTYWRIFELERAGTSFFETGLLFPGNQDSEFLIRQFKPGDYLILRWE